MFHLRVGMIRYVSQTFSFVCVCVLSAGHRYIAMEANSQIRLNFPSTNHPTNVQKTNHQSPITNQHARVRQKPLMSRRSAASHGDIHHFPSPSPPYFNAAPSHDMIVYTSGRRRRQGTKNVTRPSRPLQSQATDVK